MSSRLQQICLGMAAPVPFKIDIPEEALKDLRERLLRARLPEPLEGVGWKYGTEYNYLKVRKPLDVLERKRAMLHQFVACEYSDVQHTREVCLVARHDVLLEKASKEILDCVVRHRCALS